MYTHQVSQRRIHLNIVYICTIYIYRYPKSIFIIICIYKIQRYFFLLLLYYNEVFNCWKILIFYLQINTIICVITFSTGPFLVPSYGIKGPLPYVVRCGDKMFTTARNRYQEISEAYFCELGSWCSLNLTSLNLKRNLFINYNFCTHVMWKFISGVRGCDQVRLGTWGLPINTLTTHIKNGDIIILGLYMLLCNQASLDMMRGRSGLTADSFICSKQSVNLGDKCVKLQLKNMWS